MLGLTFPVSRNDIWMEEDKRQAPFVRGEWEAFSRRAYKACPAFSKGQDLGGTRGHLGDFSAFGTLTVLKDF